MRIQKVHSLFLFFFFELFPPSAVILLRILRRMYEAQSSLISGAFASSPPASVFKRRLANMDALVARIWPTLSTCCPASLLVPFPPQPGFPSIQELPLLLPQESPAPLDPTPNKNRCCHWYPKNPQHLPSPKSRWHYHSKKYPKEL